MKKNKGSSQQRNQPKPRPSEDGPAARSVSREEYDAAACFEQAERYYAQKDYKQAFQWYQKTAACKDPNPVVFFNLGYALQFGEGTEVDIAAALDYYEKAASYELPQALYNLAYFYQNGIIVPKDPEKAVRLCREATRRLNEVMNQQHQLQSECGEVTERLLVSVKLLEDSAAQVKRAEEDKNQALAELTALSNEKARLADSLNRFRIQLVTTNQSVNQQSAENQHLQARISEAEKTIAGKEDVIQSLNREIAKQKNKLEELTERFHQLERAEEKLQAENAALAASIREKAEDYQSVVQQNSQLIGQLSAKDNACAALQKQLLAINSQYHQTNSLLEIERNTRSGVEARLLEESAEKQALQDWIQNREAEQLQREAALKNNITLLSKKRKKYAIISGLIYFGLGCVLALLIYFLLS